MPSSPPDSSMRPPHPSISTPTRRLSQLSSHLSPQPSKTPRAAPPSSESYRYFLPFNSTWRDNDQYSHFNNTVYSQYFDSITNSFLLTQCKMDHTSPIGLIVHSETSYSSQLSYPDPIIAGLSISSLSPRKIVWNIALFKADLLEQSEVEVKGEVGMKLRISRDEKKGEEMRAAAWGTMTHVFVEREGRNKVVEKLPDGWEEKLRGLLVAEERGGEKR